MDEMDLRQEAAIARWAAEDAMAVAAGLAVLHQELPDLGGLAVRHHSDTWEGRAAVASRHRLAHAGVVMETLDHTLATVGAALTAQAERWWAEAAALELAADAAATN